MTEPLLIQCAFALAVAIFVASAIRRLLKGPRADEMRPEPASPDLSISSFGPPPLPPAYSAAWPYAPPLSPATAPPPESAYPPQPEAAGLLKVATHWYRYWDLLGLAFFVALYYLLWGGGEAAPQTPPAVERYTVGKMVVAVAFQVICGGIALAIMARRTGPVRWLGLRWRKWPLCFAIAPTACMAVWMAMRALVQSGWFSWLERVLHAKPTQDAVEIFEKSQDPGVVALMGFSAVIMAPLVEETIFRGYLYPVAKRFAGPLPALLFSSLVFAAAHGSAVALLPLFVLAMLLCALYEVTGSLWANVSVHCLFNLATVGIKLLTRDH